MSGIVYFWTSGSQGLAALIFCVSILIPMLKLGTLGTLVWTVGRRSPHHPHQRALLFRVIEFVGRWSMLDVFVVALMVGLVHFRGLAIIEAGPGAAAFGAVVVLTMMAARSFDPRLIWDRTEIDHD
jgi:paraquat-inducible protein A